MNFIKKAHKLPYFMAMVLSILFGIGVNLAVKNAWQYDAPQHMILFYRYLGGFAVAILFLGLYGKESIKTKKPLLQALFSINVFIAVSLFFWTIGKMPLAVASTLHNMSPLLVPLGAFLILKERIPAVGYVPLLIGFFGALMATGFSLSEGFSIALIIALLSTLISSFNVSLGKYLLDYTNPKALIMWPMVISFISSLLLALALGMRPLPFLVALYLVSSGVLGSLAWLLSIWAYKHLKSSEYATLKYVSVPLNVLFAYLFFAEIPTQKELIGIFVIMMACVVTLSIPSMITFPRRFT